MYNKTTNYHFAAVGEGFYADPGSKTDGEIIHLFLERSENAILAVDKKYRKYCIAVAMNILNDRQDADECFNDALLKLWESIPPQKPDNLPGFLAKITKNISLNRYEKLHAAKRGNGEMPLIWDELSECVPDKSNVERHFEQKELLNEINAFLKKLSRTKRDIFVLRYWYCMSVTELSGRLGITENNAAVTLLRLRKRLMEHLQKRGF